MPAAPTPDQTLQKVLKIARLNGWSVALFAGFCTLFAALVGDLTGGLVGLLVVAAGAMEIRGYRMLRRRNPDGMAWLIRAQLFLLTVVLVYAVSRVMSFDRELALENLTPEMRDALRQLEMKPEDIIPIVQRVVWALYGGVALATCLYQGGLAYYYRRRRPAVAAALAAPPLPPAI